MAARPVALLVEDDPDDAFLLEDACKRLGHEGMLRVARNGEEALAYLLGQGDYADRQRFPLPRLVLLDMKLPRMTGLEVLEWRRGQPAMLHIPVIVLTASQSEEDVARAYELGANSYLVKPVDSTAQLAMVKAVCAYWIDLNKTPASALGA